MEPKQVIAERLKKGTERKEEKQMEESRVGRNGSFVQVGWTNG